MHARSRAVYFACEQLRARMGILVSQILAALEPRFFLMCLHVSGRALLTSCFDVFKNAPWPVSIAPSWLPHYAAHATHLYAQEFNQCTAAFSKSTLEAGRLP